MKKGENMKTNSRRYRRQLKAWQKSRRGRKKSQWPQKDNYL